MTFNNITLCGYSKIGEQVAHALMHERFELIILENDKESYEKAISVGYKAFLIDIMDDESLIYQGAITQGAEAIFVMFHDPNVNLYVTLSARTLDKNVFIVALGTDDATTQKLMLAGANKVVNPYELGAKRIYEILKKPHVDYFVNTLLLSTRHELGDEDIRLREFVLPRHEWVYSHDCKNLTFLDKYQLILLGVIDHEESHEVIFHTKSVDYTLTPGDTLIVLGRKGDVKRFGEFLYKGEQ